MTQDQPSSKRILFDIKDGEPYDLPQIKPKINAIGIIMNDMENSVLTIDWDSEFYYAALSFSEKFEEKLIKFIEKNLNSAIETRLKLAKTLNFFLNCFSFNFVKDKVLPIFSAFCCDSH